MEGFRNKEGVGLMEYIIGKKEWVGREGGEQGKEG